MPSGWAYSLTLGFALVYLGEHYVTDLPPAPAWWPPCGGASRWPSRRSTR